MTKNKSRQRSMLKYVAMLPIALVLVLILSQKDVLANLKASETIFENQIVANTEVKTDNILGDIDEMPRFPGCEEIAEKEQRKELFDEKADRVYVQKRKIS